MLEQHKHIIARHQSILPKIEGNVVECCSAIRFMICNKISLENNQSLFF